MAELAKYLYALVAIEGLILPNDERVRTNDEGRVATSRTMLAASFCLRSADITLAFSG